MKIVVRFTTAFNILLEILPFCFVGFKVLYKLLEHRLTLMAQHVNVQLSHLNDARKLKCVTELMVMRVLSTVTFKVPLISLHAIHLISQQKKLSYSPGFI